MKRISAPSRLTGMRGTLEFQPKVPTDLGPRLLKTAAVILILTQTFLQTSPAFADSNSLAVQIFYKLNGYLLPEGSLRTQMVNLVGQGKLMEAAHLATEDDSFYNVTLVEWAAAMSNSKGSAPIPLNDFVAMVV